MDCADEVAVLKREIGPLVGGTDRLSFDILNARMTVESSGHVPVHEILRAVEKTGMRAEVWEEKASPQASHYSVNRLRFVLTALSGSCVAAGFGLHAVFGGGWVDAMGAESASGLLLPARLAYLAAILSGGWLVLPKAWLALRRLRPDMNLLMVVAVAGAVGIGEWFEAATVAFLFSVSLLLESWSVGRARRAVAALMNLAPPKVRLRSPDGSESEVPPEQVPVGSLTVVLPGERVSLDGMVAEGFSAVSQAAITGENMPVPKEPGKDVFAGTVNGDGLLLIRTTKAAQDTMLARIIRMVSEAQSRRAPSEQWIEKFAQVYTPIILVIAVCIAVLPPMVLSAAWQEWLYRALVLLVIACPCALVISTPVTIVAGLASAARNGVLVKGGTYLEACARLKAVAMDKTGTLTKGEPAVVEIVALQGHSEAELLARAAAIEANTTHPIAKAIIAHAKAQGIEPSPASNFQIHQGKGASAQFNGKLYWLGSHKYLEERCQETPSVHERLEALAQGGRSVVVIGTETHVCGFIALEDTLRENAKETLVELRATGIGHVIMLTGDNRSSAEAIGAQAGVDEVKAELLPENKVTAVEELTQRFGAVAMVGDGVNDAPALARATVGIAMGAAGSDAAIESADIALMSDDLSKLPWLIHHSHRTLAIIRQNIFFALAIKGAFVALTFLGFATLWSAIVADLGASLLVIFNGMRLLNPTSKG